MLFDLRSARDNCNATAMRASASADADTGRPCSIHVYQVGLTPHNWATSSRRRPGVRRRGPGGKPTAIGDSRSRCARMKSPSARAGVASSGGAASVLLAAVAVLIGDKGMRLDTHDGRSDGGSGSVDTRITAQLVPVQEGAHCSGATGKKILTRSEERRVGKECSS